MGANRSRRKPSGERVSGRGCSTAEQPSHEGSRAPRTPSSPAWLQQAPARRPLAHFQLFPNSGLAANNPTNPNSFPVRSQGLTDSWERRGGPCPMAMNLLVRESRLTVLPSVFWKLPICSSIALCLQGSVFFSLPIGKSSVHSLAGERNEWP